MTKATPRASMDASQRNRQVLVGNPVFKTRQPAREGLKHGDGDVFTASAEYSPRWRASPEETR